MSQRRRVSVAYDDISIDVILDEPDTAAPDQLVLLPSSSRDSEDFDEISEHVRGGRLSCAAPAAAGHVRQQRPDGRPDLARLRPRRRHGDRAAGQWPRFRPGACLRPVDRALRGGRFSASRARRDPGSGSSEIRQSGPAGRNWRNASIPPFPTQFAWQRCRPCSSHPAMIHRPGLATGTRWHPKASAPPARRHLRRIGGPPDPRRCWISRPSWIPGARRTRATASATI